jgi:hypothetical protein
VVKEVTHPHSAFRIHHSALFFPMLPLLNAIYSKLTSDSALTNAFTGGLHRDRAPQGTGLPYLVSHVVESKLQYSYTGVCRSTTLVRFSGFSVGHDATASLMDTLTSQLDDTLLTLSSGTNDTVTRIDDPAPKLHHQDSHGNDVWEWEVSYEYGVKL